MGIFVWSTVYQNASADIDSNSAKISFLDVGQGDSALINLPANVQILIDAGENSEVASKIKQKMPTFDREIEYVFLSHPDSDHIGGFEAVMNSYKVNQVYLNTDQSDSKTFERILGQMNKQKISHKVISAGESIYIEDLIIQALWPKDKGLSENNQSLVLLVKLKNARALFTGDLEIEGQRKVFSIYKEEDLLADLYKIPHHGSSGAWDENFLNKVKPKNAVISVGKNSYGHPSEKVLSGLEKLNIKYFRTDQLGTIDFVAAENEWVKR